MTLTFEPLTLVLVRNVAETFSPILVFLRHFVVELRENMQQTDIFTLLP